MKKIITLIFVLLILSPSVFGADSEKKSKQDPKQAALEDKKLAEQRAKIEEKKKDLNGTRWEVTVKSSNPKEKDTNDILTFQDHQFRSDFLAKKGYPSTNYTITLPSAEGAVWETMSRTSENVSFVRGEWNKDVMAGTITEQVKNGKDTVTTQYFFTSVKRQSIAPTGEEEKKAKEKEAALAKPVGSTALVSKETKK